MVDSIHFAVDSKLRNLVSNSVAFERKHLISMGYDPDSMTQGSYPEDILPLLDKFKCDVVDLSGEEVQLLHYLLCEYRVSLLDKLDTPFVPEEYATKVRDLLALLDNILARIS